MKKKFLTLLFATILLVTPTLTNAEDFVHEINRQAAELAKQKKSQSTPTTTKTQTTYTAPKRNPLTLTIGSENSRVSELQRFLRSTGDFTYPTITGYFGPITATAVKKYQCRLNIVCSGTPTTTGYGQMGPSTRAAVAARRGLTSTGSVQAPTQTTNATQTPRPTQSGVGLFLTRTLYIGVKGTDVTQLQAFLRSIGDFTYPTITGYYGSVTAQAVQRYQCRELSICSGTPTVNGYGVVGPQTKRSLAKGRNATVVTTPPVSPSTLTTPAPIYTPTPIYTPNPIPIVTPTTPTPPTVTYVWNTSSWNSCSNNTQTRNVTCKGSDNNTYSEAKCTTNKPTTSNTCVSTQVTATTNKSCSLNGKDITDGTSATAYQTNSVTFGNTCASQTRTCTDGVLSGSYGYGSCSVDDIGIQPFQVLLKTVYGPGRVVSGKDGTYRNYNALWSSEIPGHYKNNQVSADLVLQRIEVNTSIAGSNIGAAAMDVCLNLTKLGQSRAAQRQNAYKVTNGVEVWCFNQRKSDNDQSWPKENWRIDFPGQGLLVPDGYALGCASHVTADSVYHTDPQTGESIGPQEAGTFSCTLYFAKADSSLAETPVQALRSPYADQRFLRTSWFSPHTNPTNLNSRVKGVWTYFSSEFTDRSICLFRRAAGNSNWQEKCSNKDVRFGNSYNSPEYIQPFDEPFNKGDQIAATCQVPRESITPANLTNICSFMFYVSVPKDTNGNFDPFEVNSTIPGGRAQQFCAVDNRFCDTSSVYYDQQRCSIGYQKSQSLFAIGNENFPIENQTKLLTNTVNTNACLDIFTTVDPI